MEENYNLDFIKNTHNIEVIKNITGKRINFKDVFEYYNNNLSNNICVLTNSDIYLDKSIRLAKNINFKSQKLFISLNRYENNKDNMPPLLNGLEANDAEHKNCKVFLKPYQESVWSQDAWIWGHKIDGIDNKFSFNLGTVGCDNHLNYLMHELEYKVLNCSRVICANHYDRLSIVSNNFGISKGNISKAKTNNTVGNIRTFLFLENNVDIPDKFTTNISETINTFNNGNISVSNLHFKKNITEIKLFNAQIISSSYSNKSFMCHNALFSNNNYWEPNSNDTTPYIQFNFESMYEICAIDISGKQLNRNDLTHGYISKFKIYYIGVSDKWVSDNIIYDGIDINNANYIKKIYIDNPITCYSIKIHPVDHVNIKALKIKFYKYDHPPKDFFKFLCNNPKHFENYNMTFFDYKQINKNIICNELSNYTQRKNLFEDSIEEGICIFVCVMNRSNQIYNNIRSWLKQKINQLIILDWNSTYNLNDYLKGLNDKRILYVRVNNETNYIRTFAQNLAGRICKYNKICKIDSDIIISDNFFENHPLEKGEFYVGEWRCARNENEKSLHGNTYLFLDDYFRINGYNEYIKDYGWDDSDFTIRLMSCGLRKKVFDYDLLYHTPHNEKSRTVNLINPKNSVLMIFVNKECLKNTVWNNDYKMQQYTTIKIDDNYIVCDRIKNNEYSVDEKIYNDAFLAKTELLKSWKIL